VSTWQAPSNDVPDIASAILGLHGLAALAVVFVMPALESSAFVGFIFPGEIAVILGGVLAFNHRVNLFAVMAAAILGAVVGDTIGYAVGRHWGNRLLQGPLSRLIRPEHAERGKAFLAKRGGRAVFFGRFTAALRVMVPGLAGMSGISYPRFAVSNVLGGTLWAVTFVLLGYAAGESWRRVAKTASNAGLLLLGFIVVVAVVVGLARWAAHHPAQIRARLRWIERLPGVRWAYRRFQRQLAWLARRMRPSAALGLSLTAGFTATLLLGTAFVVLASKVAGEHLLRDLDQPVLHWLVRHRSPAFTTAMKVVTTLGSLPVLTGIALVIGLALWVAPARGTPRALLIEAVTTAGAVGLWVVMKALVARPRPPASAWLVGAGSWSFPSGHATQAMAVLGGSAALAAAASKRWSAKAAEWAAALLLIAAVGFSRLYLGVQWLTDVLGGLALGALWLGLVLIAVRALAELRARGRGRATGRGDPDIDPSGADPYPGADMPVAPRR
jgi:membrane protein DedA with SNARE-associated domain/membrane-associated phospholipid phosphatase